MNSRYGIYKVGIYLHEDHSRSAAASTSHQNAVILEKIIMFFISIIINYYKSSQPVFCGNWHYFVGSILYEREMNFLGTY